MNNKLNKPTESELEILRVLWDRDEATVRQVHEELSKTKEAGYTTTLKLMQIMHEKGLVKRDETNKTHKYTALISREHTQKQFMCKMIDTLFQGSSTQLVIQALGHHKTSEEELEQIQQVLDNLKSNHIQ